MATVWIFSSVQAEASPAISARFAAITLPKGGSRVSGPSQSSEPAVGTTAQSSVASLEGRHTPAATLLAGVTGCKNGDAAAGVRTPAVTESPYAGASSEMSAILENTPMAKAGLEARRHLRTAQRVGRDEVGIEVKVVQRQVHTGPGAPRRAPAP